MKQQITLLALLAVAAYSKTYEAFNMADFQALNFTQQLDHFNALDRRNFTQRYWVNNKYFDNSTGPVFLYICGESTCKPPSERGFALQVCQALNCLFYVVEHRYYGAS